MKTLLGLIALVGVVSCICNTPDYDLNFIIDDLILDTNVAPQDDIISVAEFQNEMLAKWDMDGDQIVLKTEFVTQWVATYSDCEEYTKIFFDNMDANGDGALTESDLIAQMFELAGIDFVVRIPEFRAFVLKKHPHQQ